MTYDHLQVLWGIILGLDPGLPLEVVLIGASVGELEVV